MEEKKCCCSKNTFRDEKVKHDLIVRLNRIEGQIRGIKNMVEKDAYCADILTQSSAASAAIISAAPARRSIAPTDAPLKRIPPIILAEFPNTSMVAPIF